MSLPTAPQGGSGSGGGSGGGGLPVSTPQQVQARDAQAKRQQEQFKLRMAIADNLRRIKHVFIVMSGKGGVGKSTVAVNLAAAFAAEGHQTGLLDLDLTNPNVPLMLGVVESKPTGHSGNIEPVPVKPANPVKDGGVLKVMSTEFFLRGRDAPIIWRGPIKMNMINQLLGNVHWGDLDYLVIDLPPGTGDEPLTIAQLLKDADGVVLVTTPQTVSVADVKKSVAFVQTMDLPVTGIVENMGAFHCPHCAKETDVFGAGGGERLANEVGVPLLGRIPLEPRIVQAGETGVPFVWQDEASATRDAFFAAIAEIKKRAKSA